MSYKVSLDAGHGMNTGGKRTPKLKKDLVIDGKVVKKKGQIIHEFEFNILVAKSLRKALERCGVQVKIVNDETGKTDTPLAIRANRANAYGSDLHISCHYNAIGSCVSFQNRCHGVLVLKTKGCQSKSSKLAECVHNAIKGNYSHTYGVGVDVNWSGFTLAILRRTKMPAILIEYGFMDYENEAMKMLDPSWYTKLAEDTCKGVCDYLGIKYKKPSTKDTDNKKKGEGAVERIDVEDFVVRVKSDSLNVRKGPGVKFDQVVEDGKKLVVKKGGAYTITHVNATKTWGYLKSGAGWICITDDYVERV